MHIYSHTRVFTYTCTQTYAQPRYTDVGDEARLYWRRSKLVYSCFGGYCRGTQAEQPAATHLLLRGQDFFPKGPRSRCCGANVRHDVSVCARGGLLPLLEKRVHLRRKHLLHLDILLLSLGATVTSAVEKQREVFETRHLLSEDDHHFARDGLYVTCQSALAAARVCAPCACGRSRRPHQGRASRPCGAATGPRAASVFVMFYITSGHVGVSSSTPVSVVRSRSERESVLFIGTLLVTLSPRPSLP